MINNLMAAVFLCIYIVSAVFTQSTQAANSEELAKKLANPVASLISVPLQLNYDSDIGPSDSGDRTLLNIQPVLPFSLNEDWNIISRTILPLVSQDDIFPGAGNQSGVGDVVQSFFFSPKDPTSSGWILGVGPVLLLPTASDDLLGAEKWGAGPTGVALKQDGPWTYGALFNHISSFAGDNHRENISSTFLQPFVSYTTPQAVTYTLLSEATYDWKSEQEAIPLNAVVTKVTKVGEQLISFGGGIRYWVESTDGGPEGFGFRLVFTFLFPK